MLARQMGKTASFMFKKEWRDKQIEEKEVNANG
jgi:hypothetical protein